jgi:hypothetical protein
MPRLRGGNAHAYNCYVNNTEALAAKNLRNAKVALIPGGIGSYKFDVTLERRDLHRGRCRAGREVSHH